MMTQIKERGFTLIELLVVIAIIGILAGVVLTSLNSARTGANDSSAKSSMASIRSQAEIFYTSTGNTYTGMCTNPDIVRLLNATVANTPATVTNALITTATTVSCRTNAAGTAWLVQAPLNATGRYYCADSRGAVIEGPAAGIVPVADFECI